MKKTIIIITYLLLIIGITACPCGNSDPHVEYFHLIGFEYGILNIERNEETKGINYDSVTDTIFYNNYGLEMYPKTKHIGIAYHFSLIPSVYACVPPPIQQSNEVIEKIEIITHQDFDSTHLAGSNVADLFNVLDIENLEQEHSVQVFLEKYPNPSDEGLTFLLRTKPHKTGEYSFTFKYYQSGGEVEYIEVNIDKKVISI